MATTREPGDLPFKTSCFSGRGAPGKALLPLQDGSVRLPRTPIEKDPAVCGPMTSDERKDLSETTSDDVDVTIFVCTNCREATDSEARPGIALIEALRVAVEGKSLAVKPVTCLANCDKSPSAAFNHRSGWSYVFGHLSTENVEDIVTGAMMLAKDERGFLPLRGRPMCLRGKGMTARIPPFHHHEDMPS
jgi:predicted metal-binding protein